MDKFNKYSFIFGLGSVVVPCALYFLFQHLFGVRESKLTITDKPNSSEHVVVTKTEALKTDVPVPVKIANVPDKSNESKRVRILYGTCTGTARKFAEKLRKRIDSCTKYVVEVTDLKDYNEDNLDKEEIVLFICSTWSEGRPPESASQFFEWLKDYATDFRVSKNHLSKVKYAVFGLGGDIYDEFFAKAPKDIHNFMEILGATPIMPVEFGDDASDLEMKYNKWSSKIATEVQNIYRSEVNGSTATNNVKSSSQQATNKFHKQQKQVKADAKNKSVNSAAAPSKPTSTGCCNDNKPSAEGSTCCGGGGGGAEHECADEEVLEEEEEDLINNHYVTMDQVEEGGAAPAPPKIVKRVVKGKVTKSASSGGCCGSSNGADHKHQDNAVPDLLPPLDEDEEAGDDDEGDFDDEKDGPLVDLEDIGSKMDKAKRSALKAQLSADAVDGGSEDQVKREMVTKLQRKALTKEGYRIIGTHSAVKLCRWTKNQMRGRGGCYKHSFYGITSYQCMEATPSLACANKCVFCWRHHKNPVGTEWRWKEDEPDFIVNEAVELHRGMINEMRGVPGVQPERLLEAFKVRHCALSLVGEPIMYPRINEMLKCLHDREISTFMVTNAQFPDRIAELDPVTQLYVSVDASNKESLKAIDRPLFKDFWERFLASLKAMSEKRQRTVYRMTLVSGWNMNEDGYVELIESGLPDFIEIKAMTYCGKSDASSLTMQNVPWHKDVCEYGDAICRRLLERGVISTRYSIATEHEHSCCILLAREDKFKVNGVWNTWIDYPKFNSLMQEYYASGRTATFTSEDYMAPTPDWALYKSAARGFDPEESRWHRNKTTGQLVENEYKSSDSGCG